MKNLYRAILAVVALLAFALPAPARQKVDPNKVAGSWSLEVNAGGEFYYLTLDLKVKDGKLEGGLSEQNGMFKDAPLAAIEFDGTTLKFDVKIPTPPDGAERLVKIEMKLVDAKLEGILTITDMGLSAGVTGVKK
jgi:hypothetical protein